jgi:hypothetical protein
MRPIGTKPNRPRDWHEANHACDWHEANHACDLREACLPAIDAKPRAVALHVGRPEIP